MTRQERRRRLVRDVTEALIDHPGFTQVLREVVLAVVVQQDRVRRRGLVLSFLDLCREARCGIYVDESGRVLFREPGRLTPEMRAVLAMSRHDIAEELRSYPCLWEESNGHSSNGNGRQGQAADPQKLVVSPSGYGRSGTANGHPGP